MRSVIYEYLEISSHSAEVVSAPSVIFFKGRLNKYWSDYWFTLEPEDFLCR